MRALGLWLVVGGVFLATACGDGGDDESTTAPTITSISVTCSPAIVTSDQTSSCSANVSGTGNFSSAVTWSASAGSVNSSGLFTAPPVSSATSVTITATSTQDSTRSGSATVTVNPATTAYNVLPIIVDGGPPGIAPYYVNGLFASVRVCAPGSTTQCQTIDHVLVDTGSVGLRLLSAAGDGQFSLSLPQQKAPDGNPLVECLQFVDGFTWGPVAVADIYLGSEVASSTPIQVIAPADVPEVPSSCNNTGTNENTLSLLGVNGILGVGLFLQDCGEACSQQLFNLYYSCPNTGCVETQVPTVQQVQNPVALFANDNNGVIVKLPAVSNAGQATVNGFLVFGIGTQSNNGLDGAVVYATTAVGSFTVTYKGKPYASSFIDSGSNGLYFLTAADAGLPLCSINSSFYCPTTEKSFTTTNEGSNGVSGAVTFNIAHAETLFDSGNTAFNNLGGTFSGAFDYGLPFFFGRNLYVAIENQNTPGGVGPYWAY
jgi:hypothetical protein